MSGTFADYSVRDDLLLPGCLLCGCDDDTYFQVVLIEPDKVVYHCKSPQHPPGTRDVFVIPDDWEHLKEYKKRRDQVVAGL